MKRLLVVLAALTTALLVWPAAPASAHPLGNFTVNQYEGLTLHPDRVEVTAVVDLAELPTRQERSTVGGDAGAYAAKACRELASEFGVWVGPDRLQWTIGASSFRYAPGSGGLDTPEPLPPGLTNALVEALAIDERHDPAVIDEGEGVHGSSLAASRASRE